MIISSGSIADLPAVAALHVRSRQHTYRHIIPVEQLDALSVADAARKWTERFLPTDRLLLAYEGDRLVGFSYFKASTEEARCGELNALHVDPEWHGTRVGHELMLATRTFLTDNGFRKALLWVLAGNERAIRFYERDGWVHDGTRREGEIAGAMTLQLLYLRRLP